MLAISDLALRFGYFYIYKLAETQAKSPKEFKRALDGLLPSGYQVATFAPHIEEAMLRAKANDTNPAHFMPNLRETNYTF